MATFDHIFIAPQDFDKSMSFYRDTLSFQEVQSWGEQGTRGALLKSAAGMAVVIAEQHEPAGDAAWSARRHIDVADCLEAVDWNDRADEGLPLLRELERQYGVHQVGVLDRTILTELVEDVAVERDDIELGERKP